MKIKIYLFLFIGLFCWSCNLTVKDMPGTYVSNFRANNLDTLRLMTDGTNEKRVQARPTRERLSAAYARGATGPVNVFQNATKGVSLQSVWRTTEYRILNGKNTIIYHNVFLK